MVRSVMTLVPRAKVITHNYASNPKVLQPYIIVMTVRYR